MKRKLLCVAAATTLFSAAADAQEINFSGFASIVGGMTTSNDVSLDGYDNTLSFSEGSLFALQAQTQLSDKLGATVQVLAKGGGNDQWKPDFEWAFLSYDVNDDLRVLAGRQIIPFFMYSDYKNVSYAYSWISPPTYSSPFDAFDGVSAMYNTSFGSVDANFHVLYGGLNDNLDLNGQESKFDISGLAGLAATFTYDWLTVRGAYFYFDQATSPIFDSLAAGFTTAGFPDVADKVKVENESLEFFEAGIQMNFDKLQLAAEYKNVVPEEGETAFAETKSYYVMAGYRVKQDLMLHITYDQNKSTPSTVASGITNPALAGPILGQKQDIDNVTLGARYDFDPSAALKLEYTIHSDNLDSNKDTGLVRAAIVTIF